MTKIHWVLKKEMRKIVQVEVRNGQQSNSFSTFPQRHLHQRLSDPSSLHQDPCVSIMLFCSIFSADTQIAICHMCVCSCVCSHRCRQKIQIHNFFFFSIVSSLSDPMLKQCVEVSFKKGYGRLKFFELQLIPGSYL